VSPPRHSESQQFRRDILFRQSSGFYSVQLPYAFNSRKGPGKVILWEKQLGAFVQEDYRLKPNLSVSVGLRYNWQNVVNDNTQFAPRFAFATLPDKQGKNRLSVAGPEFSTTA